MAQDTGDVVINTGPQPAESDAPRSNSVQLVLLYGAQPSSSQQLNLCQIGKYHTTLNELSDYFCLESQIYVQ